MAAKNNLWSVIFDCSFNYSFGSDSRSNLEVNRRCFVLTSTDRVCDVSKEINAALGSQFKVDKIHSAEWLGEVINQ